MRATAAAPSAFAPNPYTVSVGNATSPPLRINSAAPAISSSLTLVRHIFFAVARYLARLLPDQVRVYQRVDVSVQHAIHVPDRQLRAVVFNHPVRRQHVTANLVAEIDLQLRVFQLLVRCLLLGKLVLIQLG